MGENLHILRAGKRAGAWIHCLSVTGNNLFRRPVLTHQTTSPFFSRLLPVFPPRPDQKFAHRFSTFTPALYRTRPRPGSDTGGTPASLPPKSPAKDPGTDTAPENPVNH